MLIVLSGCPIAMNFCCVHDYFDAFIKKKMFSCPEINLKKANSCWCNESLGSNVVLGFQ